MNAKEKHQCSKMIWRYRPYYKYMKCGTPATVERDGKWYCKRHDPLVVAAKNEKRNIEMRAKRKRDADTRRYESAKDHFCDGLSVEFMETHRATEWLKIEDLAEGMSGKETP